MEEKDSAASVHREVLGTESTQNFRRYYDKEILSLFRPLHDARTAPLDLDFVDWIESSTDWNTGSNLLISDMGAWCGNPPMTFVDPLVSLEA